MKLFLLIVFWMSALISFGQEGIYSVYLVDMETKNPVANATLYFQESRIAFLSDDMGKVRIRIGADLDQKIVVQHVSYQVEILDTVEENDSIYLSKAAYVIPTIHLKQLSALEVVRKSIENIQENYQQSPFISSGFYRQIHREDDYYVRLIEASISVKHESYNPAIKAVQEEVFNIAALRKSYNYERNGEQHGDHLVDLFLGDPIKYLEKGVLNPMNLTQYSWTYKNMSVDYYEIEFQNRSWNLPKNLHGLVKINAHNYAIEKIELREFPNLGSNFDNKSNWEFLNGWYEIKYAQENDFYYPIKSTKWYHHIIWNEYNPTHIDHLIEEKFEWIHSDVVPKGLLEDLVYTKNTNLYSKSNANLSLFDLIKVPLIEDSIKLKRDLGHKFSLEYQFENP